MGRIKNNNTIRKMMKSMAVAAALAFVTVQAHNGQADARERDDVDVNREDRRLLGSSGRRDKGKGRRLRGNQDGEAQGCDHRDRDGNCIEDDYEGRRLESYHEGQEDKREKDDIDINEDYSEDEESDGERRLESRDERSADKQEREDIDVNEDDEESDEGRRLKKYDEAEFKQVGADHPDDGGRRLQG